MTPETRKIILPMTGLVGSLMILLIILAGVFPITTPGPAVKDDRAMVFLETIVDLYTANIYETANPRAKSALRRKINELRSACGDTCPEDLRFILGRLTDVSKEELTP